MVIPLLLSAFTGVDMIVVAVTIFIVIVIASIVGPAYCILRRWVNAKRVMLSFLSGC